MAAYCNYARNSAGEMWFAAPGEIQLKKVTQYIDLARLGEETAKLGEGSQRAAVA